MGRKLLPAEQLFQMREASERAPRKNFGSREKYSFLICHGHLLSSGCLLQKSIAACLNERREWWSMPARRFPPRWSVEELDAGFVVRDHNGQTLAL
jgi:hypothetical protein